MPLSVSLLMFVIIPSMLYVSLYGTAVKLLTERISLRNIPLGFCAYTEIGMMRTIAITKINFILFLSFGSLKPGSIKTLMYCILYKPIFIAEKMLQRGTLTGLRPGVSNVL